MPRANSSVPRHRRHRKIVKQAKGYYGARSRTFKSAKDAVVKAGLYAYRDRRQRKRQFRRLWITRINAACRLNGTTYSAFINGLKIKLGNPQEPNGTDSSIALRGTFVFVRITFDLPSPTGGNIIISNGKFILKQGKITL